MTELRIRVAWSPVGVLFLCAIAIGGALGPVLDLPSLPLVLSGGLGIACVAPPPGRIRDAIVPSPSP